jgi:NADH:ubiquinone oxidoreductase subunit 6 (subunit J)
MSLHEIVQYAIFGFLALVTVGGALKVVSTRSMIHAAFWLFPVFAGVAGFYLYLDAQFLAAVQVLLYIGAILVLIIFAVTLTRNANDTDRAQSNGFVLPVAFSALVLLIALGGSFWLTRWPATRQSLEGMSLVAGVEITDVSAIGLTLLQQYLIPFELISVLLLAAMIGAIVLARKERTEAEVTETPAEVIEGEEARELAQV